MNIHPAIQLGLTVVLSVGVYGLFVLAAKRTNPAANLGGQGGALFILNTFLAIGAMAILVTISYISAWAIVGVALFEIFRYGTIVSRTE